jgi:hypothetical protein
MNPNRPGFKTSEFLVTVLTAISALVAASQDLISSGQATRLGVYGAIAYIVSRGLAKYEQRGGPGQGGDGF